jgi:rhodanese-related sulfurtransferase
MDYSLSEPRCYDRLYDTYIDPLPEGTLLSDMELIAAFPKNGWTSIDCDEAIFGCTVRDARNYNKNANIDDGSCRFGDVCSLIRDPKYVLMDTRMPSVYTKEHLPCAINIPIMYLRQNITNMVGHWERDLPILIQCGKLEGTWAAEVKKMMEQEGFTDLTNIGGYSSIKKDGCQCINRVYIDL